MFSQGKCEPPNLFEFWGQLSWRTVPAGCHRGMCSSKERICSSWLGTAACGGCSTCSLQGLSPWHTEPVTAGHGNGSNLRRRWQRHSSPFPGDRRSLSKARTGCNPSMAQALLFFRAATGFPWCRPWRVPAGCVGARECEALLSPKPGTQSQCHRPCSTKFYLRDVAIIQLALPAPS